MLNAREQHDLHGEVHQAEITHAQFGGEADELIEKDWFSQTLTFNRDGHLIEIAHRNPDGPRFRTVNEYDHQSNLTLTRSYDAGGALRNEVRYSYDFDSRGRIIAEHLHTHDGKTSTPVRYTYDDTTHHKTKIQTSDDSANDDVGVMLGIEDTSTAIAARDAHRIETLYNECEQAIEIKVFNREDKLTCRIEITRNERGLPLEVRQYGGELSPFTNDACVSDTGESLTEEQRAEIEAELAQMFAPDLPMSVQTNAYNEQGKLIEEKTVMLGTTVFHQTFTYDAAGNKTEETNYDEHGKTRQKVTFTLEFDARGNWINQLVSTASTWDAEFNLSTPSNRTRRRIVYYQD